jgi:hypothetical protein
MGKPIELTHKQWNKLLTQLREDYPPSVTLVRSKMQSKLGFTPREYRDWNDNMGKQGGRRKNCIMLDFYSESKRTFFIMKYSEYLNEQK